MTAPELLSAEVPDTRHLTDVQFAYLQDLVYRKMGIRLTGVKKMMVQNRLGRFVRRSGIGSITRLLHAVHRNEDGPEAQSVYDAISTNHTFFFREINHFKFLSMELLTEMLPDDEKNRRPLNVWSAACSSGEEAYSLAIVLEEYKRARPQSQLAYEILGSDINQSVLETAEQGIYLRNTIGGFDYSLKKNYFQQGRGAFQTLVKVKKELRAHIKFIKHNLLDTPPSLNSFDIVFCRNVMIYFDADSKQALLNNIKRALRPGGYLFIGHSESLYNMTPDFELVRPTIYRYTGL